MNRLVTEINIINRIKNIQVLKYDIFDLKIVSINETFMFHALMISLRHFTMIFIQ